MADIQRTCGHCGQSLVVSEYADMATMRCPTCRQRLADAPGATAPSAVPAVQEASELKVKPRVPPAAVPPAAVSQAALPSVKPDPVTLWLGPARWRALLPLAHWLAFIVVMIALGMVIRLRFAALARWALYG